jgi:DNA-binding response OmpR family regulator
MKSDCKTILVIEDNPDSSEAICTALMLDGFEPIPAENRDQALNIIDERTPALILMDHEMPGMSAAEFVQIVRSRTRKLPVVLMTANYRAVDYCLKLGLRHVLQKPFDHRELLKVIHQIARQTVSCAYRSSAYVRA